MKTEDEEYILKERIPLKLLRLTPYTQEGFVLTDFPNNLKEAEVLEELRGGMNALVHLSLPDEVLMDIEKSKLVCLNCGHTYYQEPVIDRENNIRIEPYLPEGGSCDECGSVHFSSEGDLDQLERNLVAYKKKRDEVLGFYEHFVSLEG